MIFETNPFVTKGYAGPAFFCDREQETDDIVRFMTSGNNLALVSPRRIGKTDLLQHCFNQPIIRENCHTFVIDIYNTCSMRDFVNVLGMTIISELRPKGRGVWEQFIKVLHSLKHEISFDINGMPVWGLSVGQIENPDQTLGEIFEYINTADRPCFVAIDEFQQITKYNKDDAWKVEASLRTYVQKCTNGTFIFAGSHRHLMSEIFLSPERPFYQQVTMMSLKPIAIDKYQQFAQDKFKQGNRQLDYAVVPALFERFDQVTAYIQRVMNVLYDRTPQGGLCTLEMIDVAVDKVLDMANDAYETLLYQMPEKQRSVFLAIASAGKAKAVSGGQFIRNHRLPSSSSVISALRGLLEKDFVTEDKGVYWVYDLFFVLWLKRENYILI